MRKASWAALPLLLSPMLAVPARAQNTVVVLRVEPKPNVSPVEVFATLPSDAGFSRRSEVRQGICVFVNMPLNQEVEFLYFRPALARHSPRYTVRNAGTWTGPERVRVVQGPPPITGVRVAAAHRAAYAQPGPPDTQARLAEELETIGYLAARAKNNPAARDAVFWALQTLRVSAADDNARKQIAIAEDQLRTASDTAELFRDPQGAARFALIGKIVSERAGVAAEVSRGELESIITDPDALMTAQDAALRVNGHKGFPFTPSAWRVVQGHARDASSPLLFAANFACARSPLPRQQAVVLESIREGDASRFSAGVQAAQTAGLESARPQILERSSRTGGPDDSEIKQATIQYLGAQTDPASLRALGSFLNSDDPVIQLTAAAQLKSLQETKQITLPAPIRASLTRLESAGLRLNRKAPVVNPGTIRRPPVNRRTPPIRRGTQRRPSPTR